MAAIPICSKVLCKDPLKRRQDTAAYPVVCSNKALPFKCRFDVLGSRKLLCAKAPVTSEISSEKTDNCGQLKVLDSYFEKLENETDEDEGSFISGSNHGSDADSGECNLKLSVGTFKPADNIANVGEDCSRENMLKAKAGLGSLESYFRRLNAGEDLQTDLSIASEEDDIENEERSNDREVYTEHGLRDNGSGQFLLGRENYQYFPPSEESSDLFVVSLLAAINIAVFLFEIASPIRSSAMEDNMSLPLIYGAKINQLILDGEWWRLVTPMFLHSGFLHVALGCWVLLSFGPQVRREYGSFTFILIYILGGIAGNLLSFLHTPELTVGGTGPVFALLGAWFIYQIQNKEIIPKEDSESMYRKAVATTLFSFLLGTFEHIDDWTHLGAVLSGVVLGFLTCPTMELDDTSSRSGQKEGIALVRRPAGPCKSLTIFTLLLLILSSLAFLLGPELNLSEVDNFR